ncbi:MAG: hypothetical protein WBF88_17610 [Pusillimonas sp.]
MDKKKQDVGMDTTNKLRMNNYLLVRLLQVSIELAQSPVPRVRNMSINEFGQPRVADARTFGDFLPLASALNQLCN